MGVESQRHNMQTRRGIPTEGRVLEKMHTDIRFMVFHRCRRRGLQGLFALDSPHRSMRSFHGGATGNGSRGVAR